MKKITCTLQPPLAKAMFLPPLLSYPSLLILSALSLPPPAVTLLLLSFSHPVLACLLSPPSLPHIPKTLSFLPAPSLPFSFVGLTAFSRSTQAMHKLHWRYLFINPSWRRPQSTRGSIYRGRPWLSRCSHIEHLGRGPPVVPTVAIYHRIGYFSETHLGRILGQDSDAGLFILSRENRQRGAILRTREGGVCAREGDGWRRPWWLCWYHWAQTVRPGPPKWLIYRAIFRQALWWKTSPKLRDEWWSMCYVRRGTYGH